MAQDFAALRAAAIDRRAHNIFYRQTQLERLHRALRKQATEIQDAIVKDNSLTRKEAAIEYYAAVKCVADAYHALQPSEELEAEYSVANGKDAPHNREPVGIVYIEPIRHTFLYSVMSPLCTAIAQGNCVVILLEQDMPGCNAVLRRILSSSLEQDSYAMAIQPVTTELPASQTVFVLQDSAEQLPRSNQFVSVASPCVAVIDRTADLRQAAREILAARFAFNGRSPYAPDVVLVNEFVQKDLLHHVVHECVEYTRSGSANASSNGSLSHGAKASVREVDTAIEALRKHDSDLRVVVQEHNYAVVETFSRQNILVKRSKPILVVHSIRSLDDAIDLVSSRMSAPCAATYHFGSPETCKYLSQFTPSAVSFMNHIPRELLLGPTSPLHHPVDPTNRYPTELFTVPRPQYIIPTTESQKLAPVFATADTSGTTQLITEASKALMTKDRASGKGVGFFEQGFLMNASLILAGTIVSSLAGGFLIYKRWSR